VKNTETAKFEKYWVIAINTFMEARHNKVLFIAIGFAAALIVFSLFMGEVSLYQNEKVVKDVGMACISLLGVFVAIFMGVNSLYKELEQRTIYAIVSKPLHRHQFLVGKFLGMSLVLTFIVIMMTCFLYFVTSLMELSFDFALLPAIALILLELLVVGAMAIFFSSFSTPFLSGLFTGSAFLIGRITYELGQFGMRSKNELFKFFATNLQSVYDLEVFNLRDQAVHKIPIYAEDFWYPVVYGACLITILLTISIFLFRKRDFK
jgi:ABC-type transport system involved in multi-copper enzyme maturation permease subunit